ncbi:MULTISPECIES: CNNM domain-containing protein [Shewanella]|uniref:Hemolysin family protein n=1 Tax=Shewanella fidelis TaxID=173509 RepID=A0AAW8NP97_9GAMM|nr:MULTISPECIES: hemolysin family protein [Shewanella]MDR8524547.1 hemolysin family protein [Shewanella fidelis]MDW4812023.1 hemolysin family protein [Shewanella fidelis]MDW4817038.1 hemolysin family protein [Shewanella fidelis]MDW4821108.1 hemolysin family protein [Shewanella fidelis]MDW4822629.1 hemolysin family protein [Shewanella fidelis]
MITLIIIIFVAISVSFLCSVFEAVLLSVTPSYIASLSATNPAAADRLRKQKENVESPLVSILTLNTIAHTVGAAVAGAQAAKVFGDEMLGVFSGVLTFLILFFSEIVPKTLGANYWRSLAPVVSIALVWMERSTLPLIWMSKQVTQLMGKGDEGQYIRQEMSAMAEIGRASGELDEQESKILTQMLSVKEMPVTAIMTPRTVMFRLPTDLTQVEFTQQFMAKPFTRIPVYDEEPDNIIGYVNRNDILLAERSTPKESIAVLKKSLLVIPETAKILPLFELMIKRNTKIAMVVDEYGSNEGIVTLEDIVESLLGLEIVDSNDPVTDMQQFARKLWSRRMKDKGIVLSDDGDFEQEQAK